MSYRVQLVTGEVIRFDVPVAIKQLDGVWTFTRIAEGKPTTELLAMIPEKQIIYSGTEEAKVQSK